MASSNFSNKVTLRSHSATTSIHKRDGYLSAWSELIGGWLHDQVRLADEAINKLRQLRQQGNVLYVCQNQSLISLLHLLYSLNDAGLPGPNWVTGVNHLPLLTYSRFFNDLEQYSLANDVRRSINWGFWPTMSQILLHQSLEQGKDGVLCLNSAYQGLHEPWPYFQELVPAIKAQQQSAKPIFLVPYLLLTSIEPPKQKTGFFKRLLGNGLFDTFADAFHLALPEVEQMVRSRLGEPLNLQEWLQKQPANQPLNELCANLYQDLRNKFLNVERVAIGPRKPPQADAFQTIIQDPHVLEVGGITQDSPLRDRHLYEQKVQKIVKEIAANYNGSFLRFFSYLIEFIISKIYDEVIVDQEGLKMMAEAMNKGPVIICPSHKSHIDYLVASVSLLHSGVTPPHIVAGVNLSFWPLGVFFRRAGAFFIRRTFKGDKVYAAVFKSYVAYLMANGYSIEFFMEGGRSRTGKILMPKMGMMNMVLDAWRNQDYPDVHIIPLAIDYERIVEVGSYTKELAGGEKKPESIKGLISSSKLLSLNCGRIYLNFSEPISLKEFFSQQCDQLNTTPENLDANQWRTINQRISYRTLYEVGMAVTVTPTALLSLVMLSSTKRKLTRDQISQRIDFFMKILYSCGVKFSSILLENPTGGIEAIIENLLNMGMLERVSHHRSAKNSYLALTEVAPFELDFYKNNVMQQLAPLAMVSCAILNLSQKEAQDIIPYEKLSSMVDFLSHLLKDEFLFGPPPIGLDNVQVALAFLAAHGLVDVQPDNQVKIIRRQQLKWLSCSLNVFLESYMVVISNVDELRRFPLYQGEFTKHCLNECRYRFTTGQINCIESASKILITNAISWLLANGYLSKEKTEAASSKQPLIVSMTKETQDELLKTIKDLLTQER